MKPPYAYERLPHPLFLMNRIPSYIKEKVKGKESSLTIYNMVTLDEIKGMQKVTRHEKKIIDFIPIKNTKYWDVYIT